MNTLRIGIAIVWVLVLGAACRTHQPVDAIGDPAAEIPAEITPGAETARTLESAALALLPVETWPVGLLLRQRVRIDWPGGSESFDAVLQRRPGELALVGLGPMNQVGFRIALVAAAGPDGGVEKIELENRSGRDLPFSPAHILGDVQRVFYPWLIHAPECGACARSGRKGQLAVWERFANGRLDERRFTIPGALERGEIQIRYSDWQGEPAFPGRVDLDNGWFGYRLTLETLESTTLAVP